MGLFENLIDKYAKRIKQIEESPDAAYLNANKLFYQHMHTYYSDMVRAQAAGEPFVWYDGFAPEELLVCMDLKLIDMEILSYHLVSDAPKYIDIGQSRGFSTDVCSSIRAEVGICISEDLPPPAFVVCESQTCDSCFKACHYFAWHHKVPVFAIDSPYDESPESVAYLAEQFREMIKFAENITGHKFDEAKYAALRERRQQYLPIMKEIAELRQAVPSPMRGRDALRLGAGSLQHLTQMRDELKRRVDNKQGAIPGERLRLAWFQTAPLFTDTFTFLEKMGVVVAVTELGSGARPIDLSLGAESEDPLYRLAKQTLAFSWHGPATKRAEKAVEMCRDYKCDGAVHFTQWGCRPTSNSARIVADALERELGIPTLILDGDYMDERNFNREQYEERLEEFVQLCLALKDTDESFDYDKQAWEAALKEEEEGPLDTTEGCHGPSIG